jgi:tRNA A-37 threonylcarbamoyl transferase component Bud32/sugar lactone lactonase YvrE
MPDEAGVAGSGRYQLSEPVGQGAMGQVWRAHDELLDRDVAVKELRLPFHPLRQADLVARVVSEARSVAVLDHPGVVPVYDVVADVGTPWIVMRFITGQSLAAEIAAAGRLPWRRVAEIGGQVADALAAAHATGIVHRELKPGDILLSGDRALVTDFAIARVAAAITELTGTGPRPGAIGYLAPEQLEDAEVGPPADVWALGATLYHAVAGAPPFTGSTMAALMAAILTGRPSPAAQAGPLGGILESLLARDPAERPAAAAVAGTLAELATRPVALQPPRGRRHSRAAPGESPAPPPSATEAAAPAAPRQSADSRDPGTGGSQGIGRFPGIGTLARMVRASPRLAAGIAVGGVMVAGLALVTTLYSASTTALSGSTAKVRQLSVLSNPHGWQTAGVAFSPGGATIAVSFVDAARTNGEVNLWDSNGQPQGPPLSAQEARNVDSGLAFSPTDADRLAVADYGSVDLWNLAAGSVRVVSDPQRGQVIDVGYTPDGKTVVAGDSLGSIRLLKAASAAWLATSFADADVAKDSPAVVLNQVAVSPSGTLLADVNSRGAVRVWPIAGGAPTVLLNANPQAAGALAFSPDGRTLAIADRARVQLRDVVTWQVTATLAGPDKAPQALAFTPDGKTLAVADGDGKIYLWDLATGRETYIATSTTHWGGLAFGRDGKTLAAFAFADSKVYLYGIGS